MFDVIGKTLFIGIVVSLFLSALALAVSYRSLTKQVWLEGFFANVLDFFYLPLRHLFIKFSDSRVLDKWMASLKNAAHKGAFAKTRQRIIMAPHCMRALDCPAHSTREGIQCRSCGKCVFTQLKKDAEKYGYRVFILTGSSYVKRILQMEKADGVLLIACDYEINKVMRALKGKKIATYGVPMERDGCYGTEVDYNKVLNAFEEFK